MTEKKEQIAIRVRLENDTDIDVLNGYLKDGYHVAFQSEVAQRTHWDVNNSMYFNSIIMYILEK